MIGDEHKYGQKIQGSYLIFDWIPICCITRKRNVRDVDIHLLFYLFILIICGLIDNLVLKKQMNGANENLSHHFSYISLVLQLILCHGQYIIICGLFEDTEGVSFSSTILNFQALQVIITTARAYLR